MIMKPSPTSAERVTQQLLDWLQANGTDSTDAIPALLVTAAKLAAHDHPSLHESMVTILRTAIEEERNKALS
jgi:hypothetical protein